MMTLSLTAFSQSDTDTLRVKSFPIPVLKQIAKDLIEGDLAKEQLKITEKQLAESNEVIKIQKEVIMTFRVNESYYNQILKKNDKLFREMTEYNSKLEAQNKKLKTNNKFKSVLLGSIIAGLTYTLIRK
jgi:hypothetical protein